jgi:hypothetical protein
MAEELSPDRQRLIFRYMAEAASSEPAALVSDPPADMWSPAPFDDLGELEAAPARLEQVRWWLAGRLHRHPQLRLAVALVVLAVAVGWLVARG